MQITREQLAFEARAVAEHSKRIRRLAFKYSTQTGVSASDLAQKGFIGLIKACRRFDVTKGSSLYAYAFNYIRHEMCEEIGESAKHFLLGDAEHFLFVGDADELEDCAPTPEEQYSQAERLASMIACINSLPEQQRAVMLRTLDSDEPTSGSLASELSVSDARVRQIRIEATGGIRKAANNAV